MHHPCWLRCLAALGLSACTRVPASSEPSVSGDLTRARDGESHAEPSGLGMAATIPDAAPLGLHFEVPGAQWCNAQLDPRGRELETSASFLQIWNIVDAHARPSFGPSQARPQTEDQARALLCGSGAGTNAACDPAQAKVVRTNHQNGVGLGLLLPADEGFSVVPLLPSSGSHGSCEFEPSITVTSRGPLLHARVSVSVGEPERSYFHGVYGHHGYVPAYGGCVAHTINQTDVIIDIEHGEIELSVAQSRNAGEPSPAVELELGERAVTLHGCAQRLELRWTE